MKFTTPKASGINGNRTYMSRIKVAAYAFAAIGLVGGSQITNAALTIPSEPLIIGSGPQPNIFFAMDDSGSMDWDILISDAAQAAHTSDSTEFEWIDQTPSEDEEYRQLCSAYNELAYDPSVNYEPWRGTDDSGNPYTDVPINAVPFNPYNTTGDTVDIENDECQEGAFQNETNNCGTNDIGFIYVQWNDADSDGEYDAKECLPPQSAVPSNSNYFAINDSGGQATLVKVKELTAAAVPLAYYRKREYVLKAAVLELVNDSQAYMGLATLHNHNTVGTAISDMSEDANKTNLLNNVAEITSADGTPLRKLLDNVGRYYDDTDGSDSPAALGFSEPSPILSESEGGACQQNFTVLMSDGFYNGSDPSDVGNEDGDNNTEFDGGPHADSLSATLADVAMKYYENDLSTLPDGVPIIENVDENDAQHMVTYTVAFGLEGNNLTTPPDHDPSTSPPPWPSSISSDSKETLDDMQHAAFNGRGLFLNAKNPQDLIDALTDSIGNIEERTTFSSSSVAINSSVLRTSSLLFQARFDTSDYSGELTAFSLNSDGTINQEVWTASNNIPTENSREIFTTVDKSGSPTAIEFLSTDTDLQSAVGTVDIDGTTVSSGDIIEYIRGNQTNEQQNGGLLRDRGVLLGDIVNSSPLSVGRSNQLYDSLPGDEGANYSAYVTDKFNRFTDNNGDPFSYVYVGSNDGMLHAFDSRDGSEAFSYVPSQVHGKLKELTKPTYGHEFFVDATAGASDAYINDAWSTILAGSLGAGGKGIYTLDITTPGSFAASDVMWEYTASDNAEVGYVYHQPQVVRLANGEWGVIFGNGFNSASEKAQLIILNAADGSLIAQIDTEVGSSTNTNGLSMPFILDSNTDLIADTVYAGDLQGNMWKFDISSSNPGQWGVTYGSGNNIDPLYTAVDSNGDAQPVTTRPVVTSHPDGGFMVLFGTGKFIEPGDNTIPNTPQVQTFYGIRDNQCRQWPQ